jgi:hypothetical protein
MCSSINEGTVNDAYLIEKDGKLYKCSYRENLFKLLNELDKSIFSSNTNFKYDNSIETLREMVRLAYNKGYKIYQLTQL